MKLQNAKGMKDYLPEEMIIIDRIKDQLRKIFEGAGYNPITTPLIERFDILSAKYAGGAEILKETFKLTDQGKRELGLRYDLTVPFARIIGQNPQLKMPFKRYQMEKVYRDGPVGLGRYREFWQCDIDVVGSKSMKAEAELLNIVEDFFVSILLKPVININNRKILNGILDSFGVNDEDKNSVILIIDKFFKLKKSDLVKEIIDVGYNEKIAKNIIDTLENISKETDNSKKINLCEKIISCDEGKTGISELKELLNLLDSYGLKNVIFLPILSRGLSYYTSSVFEVTLKDNKITSTVCAGGRYDNLIGSFLNSKETYPAVGLSFGLSRIFDALKDANKIDDKKTVSDVFVYGIEQDSYAIRITQALRAEGINAELDLMNRKPGKNIKYAQSMKIPFIIAVGENEVKNNNVSIKIEDGWNKLTLAEAINLIRSEKSVLKLD